MTTHTRHEQIRLRNDYIPSNDGQLDPQPLNWCGYPVYGPKLHTPRNSCARKRTHI